MKFTVYVETTIPSYLTAWPSRDLDRERERDQQTTREWWARRAAFDLYISRLVLRECQAGDPIAAEDRLAALTGIPILEQDMRAATLAEALIRGVPLPTRAAADALHIATAAANGINYLLTWNCTHIANPQFRSKIEEICRRFGWVPPVLCTPDLFVVPGSTNG